LPLALYAALQTPGGDHAAARLAVISIALGFCGLLLSEWFARRVRRWLGR
jgi:molybdate transport system permease protein